MFRLTIILSLVFSAITAFQVRSHQQSSVAQHGQYGQQYSSRSHYGASKSVYEINAVDLIESYGYIAENYTVTTKDGYILDLIRIPHGLKNYQSSAQKQYKYSKASYQNKDYGYNQDGPASSSSYSSESSEEYFPRPVQRRQQQKQQKRQVRRNMQDSQSSSSSESQQDHYNGNEKNPHGAFRPAVLLMPGIISSADDFILGGPENGLAFVLADEGYDVFLGNVRGSKYGRKHTTLNPDTDSTYWNFCWDDIATKDLPVIVDFILKLTSMPKIYYVGHMQGSTLFYIMASEMPDYNDKIRTMVSLGPLAYMGRNENKMVVKIKENMKLKGWVVKHLGTSEFKPSIELIRDGGGSDCILRSKTNENFCDNIYFLLNGYNSDHLNFTTLAPMLSQLSGTGISVRQMMHLGQLFKTDRFAKYSETADSGQDYNLDAVKTPISVIYTSNDEMSTKSDVERLIRRLRNVVNTDLISDLTNNLDLLFANNVNEIVNKKVVKYLAAKV